MHPNRTTKRPPVARGPSVPCSVTSGEGMTAVNYEPLENDTVVIGNGTMVEGKLMVLPVAVVLS